MKKILVIEDETQTRSIFLKCLEFEGFHAFGASNGTAGIAMAQQHQPDLVVCDIMMPDMDGYSVLSALRRLPTTALIPLIFLTAKVTMPDLRLGMELGADDYLTKPCTIEQFLAATNSRLKRQEQISKLYGAEDKGRSPLHSAAQSTESTPSPSAQLPTDSIFPAFPKLAPVFRFIEANYHKPISLNDIAQAAGYSPAYLTNLVQEQTGRTVKQWVIERRMAQARTLLTTTAESVRRIAETSGYADAGYFTRQFRQIHGVSPQIWRQQSVSGLTN
jgi:YesN/AraC family two-component response regulator